MAEVFISYARVNQGFARDLDNALKKLKRDTWIDWRSIPDSAEFRSEIFAAIDAADNFLFIISPDSLRSEMCKLEVAHALAGKKRVTTILYHPVDWNELLPGLGETQWINYPELGFEETFRRLIAALDTDLEWVRQHTRLAEKARDWENNHRNESFLLRGMALQDALRWLAKSTAVNEPKVFRGCPHLPAVGQCSAGGATDHSPAFQGGVRSITRVRVPAGTTDVRRTLSSLRVPHPA